MRFFSPICVSVCVCLVQNYCLGQGESSFSEEEEKSTFFSVYEQRPIIQLSPSKDLSDKFPPVGDQGPKYSCWAWAISYLRSFLDNTNGNKEFFLKSGKFDSTKVYSPEYIYLKYKDKQDTMCRKGAKSSDILRLVLNDGAVKLSALPYDKNECKKNAQLDRLNAMAVSAKLKDYDIEIVQDLYTIKRILNEGRPLIISIRLSKNFHPEFIKKESPIWESFVGRLNDNHAMIVTGYDDVMESVKVLNSWGDDFGVNGFCWIKYSVFEPALNYACALKKRNYLTSFMTAAFNKKFVVTQKIDHVSEKGELFSVSDNKTVEITGEFKIGIAGLTKEYAMVVIDAKNKNGGLPVPMPLGESKEFYFNDVKYRLVYASKSHSEVAMNLMKLD